MPIVPQHATATSDGSGDAVFSFPQVPQGELWCGTTQIPDAPGGAVGKVTASGELLGSIYGPGSYGPWVCGATRVLAISVSALSPNTQYQAIWHADDKGNTTSTYPAPITPTVVSGGGTVTVDNFPAVQTVDGTVTATQGTVPWVTKGQQAAAVESGQVVMTGSDITLPSHPASEGVVLSAPSSNAHPIYVGGSAVTSGTGLILSPGQAPTPVLPVLNSDVLTAIGTSPDVLSYLVI